LELLLSPPVIRTCPPSLKRLAPPFKESWPGEALPDAPTETSTPPDDLEEEPDPSTRLPLMPELEPLRNASAPLDPALAGPDSTKIAPLEPEPAAPVRS